MACLSKLLITIKSYDVYQNYRMLAEVSRGLTTRSRCSDICAHFLSLITMSVTMIISWCIVMMTANPDDRLEWRAWQRRLLDDRYVMT